jgi:hypothetical protein
MEYVVHICGKMTNIINCNYIKTWSAWENSHFDPDPWNLLNSHFSFVNHSCMCLVYIMLQQKLYLDLWMRLSLSYEMKEQVKAWSK